MYDYLLFVSALYHPELLPLFYRFLASFYLPYLKYKYVYDNLAVELITLPARLGIGCSRLFAFAASITATTMRAHRRMSINR